MFNASKILAKGLLLILLGISIKLSAQNTYLPYSHNISQKLNDKVYDKNTRIHSSLKPDLFKDSLLKSSLDSILSVGVDSNRKTWVGRKLFNEHLIEINKDDYTAYFDIVNDYLYGKAGSKTTWLNTRGFQIGGTIGKKFFFYSSGYENQARFAEYLESYVKTTTVVPGQSYDRQIAQQTRDWSYSSAVIGYRASKYLDITFGQDKNFIGDGYRSMLLSDFSSNYPFLKLTGNLGNVQYTAMWLALQEPNSRVPQFSYDSGNRKKGAVMHYLDWNVTDRLSVGFFDAIVWTQYDDNGNRRGFDWGYANPIIFLRPIEAMSGSPDNAAMGLTGKYEFLSKNVVYGQFLLDEFEAKNFFSKSGSYRNKWGLQLGVRGADLFKVKNLSYLAEFNKARPYTYSSRTSILAYSHYSEPLAHPFGANFKEALGIINYSWRRFDLRFQALRAKYGLDNAASENYGKDIYKPYRTATTETGAFIGQGNTTKLTYIDSRASYLINPKINLRLELGAVIRNEKQRNSSNNTNWVTFGLRTSFRNIYQDF